MVFFVGDQYDYSLVEDDQAWPLIRIVQWKFSFSAVLRTLVGTIFSLIAGGLSRC